MLKLWYYNDGDVEVYRGQEPDWKTSFVVCAKSEEKAIINIILYNRGTLNRINVFYQNKKVMVIP